MLISGCDGQYRPNVTIDYSSQVQIKGQMRVEELCSLQSGQYESKSSGVWYLPVLESIIDLVYT
jgi:hypothetical protein